MENKDKTNSNGFGAWQNVRKENEKLNLERRDWVDQSHFSWLCNFMLEYDGLLPICGEQ